MYQFRDITDHSELSANLPAEAVSINGQYLEDAVTGYRTLYTKGRESLGVELNTYSVGTADGETIKSMRYPSRTLTVGFQLISSSPAEFRESFTQLNNLLSIEEADFIFNDEQDKFFAGTPIFNAEVEEGENTVKGEWHIRCAYPFKRSIDPITLTMEDATIEDNTATWEIDYNGARPAKPLLRATFADAEEGGDSGEDGDCGFIAFMDGEENIIQLGNPDVLDLDEYTKSATLVNKAFENTSGWLTTGGHSWNNRTANGSVSVSNTTDTYWANGKGQTQKYVKPTYGTGDVWKGVIFHRSVDGAVNFGINIVHRYCCSKPEQTGTFECGVRMADGTMLAGIIIDKITSGTKGTAWYVVNNKLVGKDSIDLSYYNTHFGYCQRIPVYVNQTYKQKVAYKAKKKQGNKYVTVTKYRWGSRTRKVQKGWKYTQSNLNSSIFKNGNKFTFKIGNLPVKTFKVADTEQLVATDLTMYFGTKGKPMHTNMVRSIMLRRDNATEFADKPNVFTAGDVVEADCNDATVYLYRDGSLGGELSPQYGALGNDWEDFKLTTGTNVIMATWSDWVNPNYIPQIEIEYNEVYI
jgi:predicted phage tail component-like protein